MSGTTVEYISASTNRFNHAAAVAPQSSLIAYGSGKLVALWDTSDPSDRGIRETLPAHTATVSCVKFIDNGRFVTADEAGVIKLWRLSDGKWTSTFSVQAHTKAVSVIAVHWEARCLVTGGSDSTVKVWKLVEEDTLEELQTISLKGRYPLDIDVSKLPQSSAFILAIASTRSTVQIYTRPILNSSSSASSSSALETDPHVSKFVLAASIPGHEDWVRAVSFSPTSASSPNQLVLASGSQDSTIRLWNVESTSRPAADAAGTDELLDAFEASLDGHADESGRQISLKNHIINVKDSDDSVKQFSITFDALLIGHEAGVTSLSWRPPISSDRRTPTLLSTSTDSSLILWSPSSIPYAAPTSTSANTTQLWIASQRFGDVGGQRLGGFVGGVWAREGSDALAWGWAGGWRRWQGTRSTGAREHEDEEVWTEVGAVSGHVGPVRGISWSPGGEYLISAGLDQTTRIHAPIGGIVWHELARPQVHGYDLVGVAFLDALRFVSVADEKVARVFEAPRGFARTVKALGAAELTVDEATMPVSASVPPLGLSNKANSEANAQSTEDLAPTRRPFEAELAAVTLWPETEKVFGHGYESITVTVSSSRSLVATACKATTPKHAVVRIYDTKTFQPFGAPLEGHALTVTRIAFSPDDLFVLTVSRDRTWRLFRKNGDQGYVPISADKSHARIIWDCAWAPDGGVFATASRDKTVKIWQPKNDGRVEWTPVATLKLPEAATAVAFTPSSAQSESISVPSHETPFIDTSCSRILAVGVETGEIFVYASSLSSEWRLSSTVKAGTAHIDHIHQLAWRPGAHDHTNGRQLASCSEDGTLRILSPVIN